MGLPSYLDVVNERVVVFDGAFGTYVQGLDLSADDFGGHVARGLQRDACASPGPTSSPACTPPSSTSASTPWRRPASASSAPCSPSTTSPTAPTISTSPPHASPARSPTATTGRPPRFVAGSIGPGTKLPSLGHIGFPDLRDAYEVQAARPPRRRRRPVPHRDLHGPAPGEGGDDRLPPGDAGRRPAGAAAGAGHDGDDRPHARRQSEIGAALVTLAAMKPDVLGINCATGPAEMQEHLRYLSHHSRSRSACCPTPACRASSTAAPTTTSRPSSSPTSTAATSPSSASASSAAAAARRPSTSVRSSRRSRDLEPARRDTDVRAERLVDLQPGHDRAGPQLPHHRRAHERQRLQGVPRGDARRRLGHVHEDRHRADPRRRPRARRVRRLRRPRRRCRHGRDRQALRHPGQRAARDRLHRAAGAGGRTAAHRRPGHPQLGQPRGRRAARQPPRPGVLARPRVRGGGDLPAHRRARPGPRRRVEDGDRPPHPRDRHRALRPVGERPDLRRADVPAVDGRRRPAPRRDVHDRGDPADQGRDPGRAHDARRVQRQLRAQPAGPPRAQQRVPPRVPCRPASTRPSSTPARSCRSTGCPTSSARSASTSCRTAGVPTTTRCSGCSRSSPT